MENVDKFGGPSAIIFKVGDDLRQDTLTLQMIKIMDQVFKKESLFKTLFNIEHNVMTFILFLFRCGKRKDWISTCQLTGSSKHSGQFIGT
jgi:hypothetical protein